MLISNYLKVTQTLITKWRTIRTNSRNSTQLFTQINHLNLIRQNFRILTQDPRPSSMNYLKCGATTSCRRCLDLWRGRLHAGRSKIGCLVKKLKCRSPQYPTENYSSNIQITLEKASLNFHLLQWSKQENSQSSQHRCPKRLAVRAEGSLTSIQ